MSDFEHLIFDQRGAIARITLNRPDDANGLNAGLARELKQAARICDSDPRIRAVVLGAEGRFFCAGGDLKEILAHGDAVGDEIKKLADDLHAAVSTLMRMSATLIVAVNGTAAGAGFSLALIGDLVLAAESARFTMAYTRAGLCPDGSSTWLLPRLVGLRKAQELALLNPTLSAAEALDIGLLTRVVADADLAAESDRLAAQIAAGARLSQAYVKKLLLASAGNDLENQMELEGQLISRSAASPDGREGIRAFVEKRSPVFEETKD
jgi:2-(1,2-epoxy-1,2-dihydrophenyl)acetyl-CoA isomerase